MSRWRVTIYSIEIRDKTIDTCHGCKFYCNQTGEIPECEFCPFGQTKPDTYDVFVDDCISEAEETEELEEAKTQAHLQFKAQYGPMYKLPMFFTMYQVTPKMQMEENGAATLFDLIPSPTNGKTHKNVRKQHVAVSSKGEKYG